MKRLNKEALDILYDILYNIRKDFPHTRFTWKYNFMLEDYCLMYDMVPKGYNQYTFENEVSKKYITPEIATKFMDITDVWICIYYDNDNCIDFSDDIEEVEIVVKRYKHNKK